MATKLTNASTRGRKQEGRARFMTNRSSLHRITRGDAFTPYITTLEVTPLGGLHREHLVLKHRSESASGINTRVISTHSGAACARISATTVMGVV